MRTLIIEGKKLDNLVIEGDINIPSFSFGTDIESIRGRATSVIKDRQLKPMSFDINLAYKLENETQTVSDALNKINALFDVKEARIQIKGEDWYWTGQVDGPYNVNINERDFFKFTVTINLADPFRYSLKRYSNTAVNNSVSILNEGTASTPFELKARALENAPYFIVTDVENNHFMIGEDNEEKPLKNYSPDLIINEFRALTGFSRMSAQESIADRYLGGSTGGAFGQTPEAWYLKEDTVPNVSGWRGAAYKRSYSRSVQNFRVTYKVRISQNQMGSGKIGHFIYDTNGRLIFSMGYQNVHSKQDSGRILFMTYNEQGEEKMMWGPQIPARYKRIKALVIYMRIERQGNQFKLSYWLYDDHVDGRTEDTRLSLQKHTFNDGGNFYQRKIGSSAFGTFKGSANHRYMSHLGIYMYELLDKPTDARDYIIKQGDEVVLDTQQNIIMVNNEPVLTEKSFSSRFFELETGLTELLISPEDAFETTVYWRDRFK